jgi:hypothetical protein
VTDSIATNAQAVPSSAEEAEPIVPARKALPGSWRAALAIFFLIAAVSRFADLGSRPFHHDESIHAFQSNTLAETELAVRPRLSRSVSLLRQRSSTRSSEQPTRRRACCPLSSV